jgi:hypothetical protein
METFCCYYSWGFLLFNSSILAASYWFSNLLTPNSFLVCFNSFSFSLNCFLYKPPSLLSFCDFFNYLSESCTSMASCLFSSSFLLTIIWYCMFSSLSWLIIKSFYWNLSSIILSSSGSAKVSLDLMTSSSCALRREHSSMYIFISTSISEILVDLMFLLCASISSYFTVSSDWRVLIFLFKLSCKWD